MEVAAGRLQPNACAVVTKPLSVLLIDDNPARAEIVEAGLASAGYGLLANSAARRIFRHGSANCGRTSSSSASESQS